MRHSFFGGGKRLRPILLLWTWEALGGDRRRRRRTRRTIALDAACALEMIHTYSLIHDDLPAMDDDVLRRGRPTCHVAFDEATAILAGDGLLTRAFEVLGGLGEAGSAALRIIAAAAGPGGMVGGQQDDLDAEGSKPTVRRVRLIHRRKTAEMIAASLAAGASLAGLSKPGTERFHRAGIQLGLAFQGADDILDVVADSRQLGKTVGKDEAADKATFVRLEGLAAARRRTARYGREGSRILAAELPSGASAERLKELAELLWRRSR